MYILQESSSIKGSKYLQERINFEIKIGEKLCNFIALSRSTSHSQDVFETLKKLELNTIAANNPFLTAVLSDFSSNLNLWHKNYKTANEGSKIDTIASHFRLCQLINKTNQLTRNKSSCIDLTFTAKRHLVMEYGEHSSLHDKTYAKLNLKFIIHLPVNGKFGIIKRQTLKI